MSPRGGPRPGAGRPATVAAVRTVRVRLGDAECEALDALCARWACTPSEAIRRALRGGAPAWEEPIAITEAQCVAFGEGMAGPAVAATIRREYVEASGHWRPKRRARLTLADFPAREPGPAVWDSGHARIRSDAPPDVRAWFEDVLGASVPEGER